MRQRFGAVHLGVLVLLGGLGPAAGGTTGDVPILDRCATLVRDEPEELESYRCYWIAARAEGLWAESVRSLEALLAIDPSNHRARLYLAAIEWDRGHERAEDLYRAVARGFAETDEYTGEIYARLELSGIYWRTGRLAEADSELERALEAAEGTGDPVLIARVQVTLASQFIARTDYGRALGLLREAEEAVFPEGPSDLQSSILSRQGRAYWALGLLRHAVDVYTREAEILHRSGDRYQEAAPRYNIALLAEALFREGTIEREEFVGRVGAALRLAAQVEHHALEARARLLHGSTLEPRKAVEQFGQALSICRRIGDGECSRHAQRLLAQQLGNEGPEGLQKAEALLDEAIRDARAAGNLEEVASGLEARARISATHMDREKWLEDHRLAIDAIERIRDVQPDGSIRARVFSRWTGPYYRLSGDLLDRLPGSPDPAGDLDLALTTVERMRARVLLDELDGAGATRNAGEESPDHQRRAEVLESIVAVQKRLRDPSLAPERRAADLADLEKLEREEATLRDSIARSDPDFARLRTPRFPSIADLQGLLAPDQALLSFQLSTRETSPRHEMSEGGSWLILVTVGDASAIRLPEKDDLEERVAAYLGRLRRRDDSDIRAAERLGEDLLGEAVRRLEPKVERLVLIPDGCLNLIPFGALRPSPGSDPLALSYEVSSAPSVTLWSLWSRDDRSFPLPRRVLAFADPEVSSGRAVSELRIASAWLEGLHLGRLPHARREVRELSRVLGPGSRLLVGADASEQALKQTDLERFGVLHFAAHAVVDHDKPERSAVILAPGGLNEDGFLQVREIVDLDLDGHVIFLTGCRSASGSFLRGEGVTSLSRAFLQAGATAVVASLWPLRDEETATLMEEFAARLARGERLAGALAGARSARIEAGAPAAAWAGLVVLGDGDVVLGPGGSARGFGRRDLVLIGLAVLALLTSAIAVCRRPTRSERQVD